MKALISALVTIVPLSAAYAAPAYNVVDLGTLGSTSSQATNINSSGQIVGASALLAPPGLSHGFLTTAAGPMTDLGTGPEASSVAFAINDTGRIAGSLTTGSTIRAFRTDSLGTLIELGTLVPNGQTEAYGINAAGQVVGRSFVATNQSHAFVTDVAGNLTDLGTLNGAAKSFGAAINDSGVVVGWSEISASSTRQHAVRIDAAGNFTDLGTLPGGIFSSATSINNAGQVVGSGLAADGFGHAFRTNAAGAMSDLGLLAGFPNSAADDINATGVVVGRAYTSPPTGSPVTTAIIYLDGLGLLDLNTLIPAGTGWNLYQATAINDAGEIVGTGTINGQSHAFALIPVPEPTSLLAACALAASPLARRRRR